MLDAMIPAAKALLEAYDIQAAARAASVGAEMTATMKVASAGRSNYLSEEQLEGTPDPGAVAVSIVLGAFTH